MAKKPAGVSDWLNRSKATHGDGNLAKQAPVKGKQSQSPIATHGDGAQKASPKGKGADMKTPTNFGTSKGGGAGPAGGGKVMMAKGLMQKGK